MIRDAVTDLWRRPWLTLVGFVVGALLAPLLLSAVSAVGEAYYRFVPIATVSGDVISADAAQVVVHLRMDRRSAPGCQFLVMRARTIDPDGEYEIARIERIDQTPVETGLPPGRYDLGLWRIVPRSDGVRVAVTPIYDCAGAVVFGAGADMVLPVQKKEGAG